MIESISGSASAQNIAAKGSTSADPSAKEASPQVASSNELNRQQEPNDERVAASERAKYAANDNPSNSRADALSLSIAVDSNVDRYVYRGLNTSTREVERQWPTEEALRQMAVFREMMGRVLDKSS